MTPIRPTLDLFIDANILLVLAFCLWRLTQAVIMRSRMRHDYALQMQLLKTFLFITILSPIIAWLGAFISQTLTPNTPLTVTDIAVAAYLRGDIALPAIQFEALLNLRSAIMEDVLEGRLPWVMAIMAGLTFGALVYVFRLVWSVARVNRALANSYLWRRTKRVDIRISDTVSVPFAARGLFRRHVVLPSGLMTRHKDLRLVLAHEFQHLRKADVEWEFVFEILRPILFWNPAFSIWKRHFDYLRELSCDQEVLATRRISPADYARCLLDFCERRVSGPWPKAMNVAFFRAGATRRALESRILAVCNTGTGDGGRRCLPVFIFALATGVSLAAMSVRQPGDWSQDRLMLSTIVNLERLEAINRGY